MNDYDRMAQLIRFLDQHVGEQPELTDLAAEAGMSVSHLRRLFERWAGVSPKAFLQSLTFRQARACLQSGASVLDAALASGLSGPGRLHDLCLKLEAATPGEIKSGGAGWQIRVGVFESVYGPSLIAQSPRGLCRLVFFEASGREAAQEELAAAWPAAELVDDPELAAKLGSIIFGGRASEARPEPLSVLLRGTPFQLQVWEALLRVPEGALVSYGQLAGALGKAGASRAVGSAVGKNVLGYLIPCHRVIRETGVVGEYRWGRERKRLMIAREAGRTAAL